MYLPCTECAQSKTTYPLAGRWHKQILRSSVTMPTQCYSARGWMLVQQLEISWCWHTAFKLPLTRGILAVLRILFSIVCGIIIRVHHRLQIHTAMSQRTFASQLILTWAIVGVPVFLAFRYFERQKIMEDLGVGNTIIMAVVLSSIPAIIICMAWRYLRKQR